jgi:hypothetical protein
MKYALIKESDVDFDTRKAAHMALAAARKELKLPMVYIKWFVPIAYASDSVKTFEHETDIRGLFMGAQPDSIFVRSAQTVDAVKETVLHETFHLWQMRQGNGFADHSEGVAQGYANDAMKRVKMYGEDEETYLEHLTGKDWSGGAVKTESAKAPNASGFIKRTKGADPPGVRKTVLRKIG